MANLEEIRREVFTLSSRVPILECPIADMGYAQKIWKLADLLLEVIDYLCEQRTKQGVRERAEKLKGGVTLKE